MGFAFDQHRRFANPKIKLVLSFAGKPYLYAVPFSEHDTLLAKIFLGGLLKIAAYVGIRY